MHDFAVGTDTAAYFLSAQRSLVQSIVAAALSSVNEGVIV
jgi:hypothetical protein